MKEFTIRPDEYIGDIAIDPNVSDSDNRFNQFLDKHFSRTDFKAAHLQYNSKGKLIIKILFSDDTVKESECGLEEFFNNFIVTIIKFNSIHNKGKNNIDWDLFQQ